MRRRLDLHIEIHRAPIGKLKRNKEGDFVKSQIILALDTDDLDTARGWIEATSASISIYKVGLEFFLKFGRTGLDALRSSGDFEIFLDLKLHDIPNTVAGAARSVAQIAPKFLTVHASGGAEMISAAVSAAPAVSITAVTILTSLNEADLHQIGFAHGPMDSAVTLAKLAVQAGARSIVCSPNEVAAIRAAVPASIELITPGVRPLGSDTADQKRTTTPEAAIASGANYVVIGRPITSFWKVSPEAMSTAAMDIFTSINESAK